MLARLLIVDENVTSRFALKARLTSANYAVTTAPGVAQAIRAGGVFSAVLLRTDGDISANLVRQLRTRIGAPVIALCSQSNRRAAYAAAANHVLDEDSNDTVIRARLRSWLAVEPVELEGFSEPSASPFDPGPSARQVAIVTSDASLATEWRHAVGENLGLRPMVLSPRSAMDRLPVNLGMILVDGGAQGEGLQHLADLRAVLSSEGRGTALGFIQRRFLADEEVRALEIGAAEVLPGYLSAPKHKAELAVLLKFLQARGADSERLLASVRTACQLAVSDSLTGLINRRQVNTALRHAHEHGGFGLLMIDIDHFKSVNDSHGHASGDTVLREVAARLTAAVGMHGQCGRYGGEEFVVILPDACETVSAAIAEKVRHAVSCSSIELDGVKGLAEIVISVSIGVAVSGPDADRQPVDDVLRAADGALLRAKAAGRDLVMLSRTTKAASSWGLKAVAV